MSLHELELVRLVSDRVICLKDGRVDKDGGKEILEDTYLRKLYGIGNNEFPEYRII
jgi:iron complex transport system ATP-binding protein